MKEDSNITVSGPSITQKEIDYVTDAVKNAWYENANIYHERFEKAFANYIGVQYAIALPSCTSAIHLALAAAGMGAGDEVIIPDITWIASAAPISYVGATPVFVDIEPDSWCISVEAFKAAITPRTKAVIPVNLYGNFPKMDDLLKVAQENEVFVLEDAAESIGSEYKGRKSGSLGDVGVFSFHGSKTMTTGEGGMLVTNKKEIYERCLVLRDHGRSSCGKMFWNDEVAYKYKMSSMQAALGLAQLERIEELIEKKREIFGWYEERLKNIKGVQYNCEAADVKNSYWMVTIAWDKSYNLTKEEMINLLRKYNIDTRPFFYPLSMLPAYNDITAGKDFSVKSPVAYSLSPYAINLPCGMKMTEELVDKVCDKVRAILESMVK